MRYLIVLLLAGCATAWQHSTKTEQQFHEERYECEQRGAAAVPFLSGPFDDTRTQFVASCLRAKGWRQ